MGIIKSKYYGIIRGFIVGIAFFLQIGLMVFLSMYLIQFATEVYFVLELISIVIVFELVNNAESYKMSWIIIILVLPVAGLFCLPCGEEAVKIQDILGVLGKLMRNGQKDL